MTLLDRLKEISEAIVNVEEKIGFRRLLLYVFLGFCIYGICNFKTLVKDGIELVNTLNEEVHNEKMEKRDELLRELGPILQELRAETSADRVLYFEYHNSKENLVGIPFKFIDLVMQNSRYGVPGCPESKMRDINVGVIADLYEYIKVREIAVCNGPQDTLFLSKFSGTYDLFSEDGKVKNLVFGSIPGIEQPVGMIVLEWMDDSDAEVSDEDIARIIHGRNSYKARINALIMSKR